MDWEQLTMMISSWIQRWVRKDNNNNNSSSSNSLSATKETTHRHRCRLRENNSITNTRFSGWKKFRKHFSSIVSVCEEISLEKIRTVFSQWPKRINPGWARDRIERLRDIHCIDEGEEEGECMFNSNESSLTFYSFSMFSRLTGTDSLNCRWCSTWNDGIGSVQNKCSLSHWFRTKAILSIFRFGHDAATTVLTFYREKVALETDDQRRLGVVFPLLMR